MTVEDLFHQYALGKAIDYKSLDENIIKQLVDTIMNDKNSSTARELAILKEANYKHLEGKLNYDGFNDNELVEVKLRKVITPITLGKDLSIIQKIIQQCLLVDLLMEK